MKTKKTQTDQSSRRTVIGASLGTLVVAVVAVIALHTPGLSLQSAPIGVPRGSDIISVDMRFSRADRVSPGAEVRFGERLVGRVTDLSTDGSDAVVTVSLGIEGAQVPSGVFAEIRLPTALGTPFIALTPPQGTPERFLRDGDIVPRSRTSLGPDLESTLASVGLLLNGSGIDQLRTVMDELSIALDGQGPEIARIRDRGDRALELYEQNQTDINRTITALDRVAVALADQRELIDRGMGVSANLLDRAAARRDTIASLLGTSARLAEELDRFTSQTSGGYSDSLRTVHTLVRDMRDFDTEVRPTLDELSSFVDTFNGAVRGDLLVLDGVLDLPNSLDSLQTGGLARVGGTTPPSSPAKGTP